jgi:hypothetical protein
VENGVNFKPIGGKIEIKKAFADDSTVWAKTPFTLEMKPQHNIYKEDGVTLMIELPPQIEINGACRVESVKVSKFPAAARNPRCIATTEHKMKILKFIDQDYIAGADNTITIKIGSIINAARTGSIEGFRVSIIVENEFLIDQYFGKVPWSLTTGTFTNMKVTSQT